MDYLRTYGDTEGPLGFPMFSQPARELDALLRTLPTDGIHTYRKQLLPAALHDLQPGERADISWISIQTPDRECDLILAGGMQEQHFRLNPIVTLNHAYTLPPVGLSLWRRQGHMDAQPGILAKTHYPVRPANWSEPSWPPDECFALVQAGLLRGKSIGFLPLKTRSPTESEVQQQPALAQVRCIIEEWLLLEYACCYLPVQQQAVVEAVSKAMVPPLGSATWEALGLPGRLPVVSDPTMLVWQQLEQSLRDWDWERLAQEMARECV